MFLEVLCVFIPVAYGSIIYGALYNCRNRVLGEDEPSPSSSLLNKKKKYWRINYRLMKHLITNVEPRQRSRTPI